YGWLTPVGAVTVFGAHIWPASASISIIPFIFLAAVLVLLAFYRVERRRERDDRAPMFEFGLLPFLTFRYGLLTTTVVAMGQLGLSYALALFLQEGKHLTAMNNGLWVLPMGLSVLLAAPIGGRLAQYIGTTRVIRIGLAIQASGLVWIAIAVTHNLTFFS